jgi:hypothetical protein
MFIGNLTKTSVMMSFRINRCWGLIMSLSLMCFGAYPEAHAQCNVPESYVVEVGGFTGTTGTANGLQVGWRIEDVSTGAVVASAGPQTTTGVAPTTATGVGSFPVTLVSGKPYRIVMIDAVGNGWSAGNGYTGSSGIRVRRALPFGTTPTNAHYIFGTTSSSSGYRRMGENHGNPAGDKWEQNLIPFAITGCGCMDPLACNYSATATLSDNSICAYNKYNLLVDPDLYGDESLWVLVSSSNGSGAGIQGQSTYQGPVLNQNFCLKDGCYTFQFYDSFGDGSGSAAFNNGNPSEIKLSKGHSPNLTETIVHYPNNSFLDLASPWSAYQTALTPFCAPFTVVGCTDQGACDYNPAANVSAACDYSCVGCMDVTAANFDPDATIQAASSCVYCADNTYVLRIEMGDLDGGGWGSTQYFLNTVPTGTVYSGSFQTADVIQGANALDLLCLPLGCYTFGVAGGSATSLSNASYGVYDQFGQDYLSGSGALTEWPIDFGLTGGCDFSGCTDPFCFNFNPSATNDDGTCICPPENSYVETAEGTTCGVSVSGSLVNAFDAEGVIGQGIGGSFVNQIATPITIQTGGVWYEFNASSDGEVIADLCGTADAGFSSPVVDGRLHVFTETNGQLTLIAANNNACLNQPRIAWIAETGENYFIYVSKTSGTAGTGFLLSVTCEECSVSSSGSTCLTAQPQVSGVPFLGSTCCQAPASSLSYTGGNGATNYGAWYTFNSADFDTFDFNATNLSNLTNLTLTVYLTGGNCANVSSYAGCIFTGTCAGSIETIIPTLTPNTDYYFFVGTTNPLTCGDFSFTTTGIYLGCTDPLADNFDQQAMLDDGTCTYSDAPANDLCSDAIVLPCNAGFIDGSLGGATEDAESALCLPELPASQACTSGFQYPSTTTTPICNGGTQTIVTDAWPGEYSQVNVVAGNTYVFGSGVSTDNITISNPTGSIVYVHGTGEAVYTATATETVRFYIHLAGCGTASVNRTRWVSCSPNAPTPDGGVWYTFTATGADLTDVYTCGSVLDTRLHVYQSASGDCTTLGCVAQSDGTPAIVEGSFDGCGFFDQDDAYVTFVTVPGATYYVYVGADGSTNGSFQIAMDCEPAITGCMIDVACNYNPDANIPDDCDYTSCACANNPDGFPLLIEMADSFGDGWATLNGTAGGYTITNGEGEVVASGTIDEALFIVDEDNYQGAEYGFDIVCLDPACYIYTFTGASIFATEQSWSVSSGTTSLFQGAPSENNAVATYPFVFGDAVCGCTDQIACNFNPAATDENGTCEYETCAGCTDSDACNYDESFTINDGSCCYDNCITLTMNDSWGDGWQGCDVFIKTLAGATVFQATLLDGTSGIAVGCLPDGCYTINSDDDSFDSEVSWTLTGIFGVPLNGGSNFAASYISIGGDNCTEGCTVQCACNFDPTAILAADELCTFDNCSGCTYEDASNFSAVAVADDGSCIFVIANPCPADLNEDGTVTTADLLVFLGAFGSICPN